MQAILCMIFAIVTASAAAAEGERGGEFDYYVLALSWSPNWCAREGDDRGAAQCRPGSDLGWSLHGLWPQFERGWPSYCRTDARDPSRSETGAMTDIMGSSGLAWHQWKKHGRCSGLPASAYFEASRAAYDSVRLPAVFRKLESPVRLPAAVVEAAFLTANPDLHPDMLTVTCRDGMISEVRLCLTRDLSPRICASDVRRDCSETRALLTDLR